MDRVAEAMRYLAHFANLTGRRFQRAYEMSRARIIQIQHGSPMLTVPMAPRRLRRELQGKKFRPVYGYRGPAAAKIDLGPKLSPDETAAPDITQLSDGLRTQLGEILASNAAEGGLGE